MKRVKDESTDEDLFRIVATHKLDRIERLLRWIIKHKLCEEMNWTINEPDISDILEEKDNTKTGVEKAVRYAKNEAFNK